MKKRVIVSVLLLGLLIMPIILASSVDSEMQKITHYAEKYETGNINYVKLMLHMSSAREGLNEVLGATSRFMGGVLKQEQIQKILGEPNEKTKWVWVEGEEHDAKLDYYVPIWKKIVFDGKKIQIRMEAFPSIFKKRGFDEFEDEEFERFEEMPEEGSIIYRLHFEVEFKRPEEQLDIQGKIDEIESLAKSGASMETLAKESVNAEMIFERFFRQGQGKCEDILKGVFGSENQRQTQQMLVYEIEFCEGDNYEVIGRLELCDECEWNWINLDFWVEGRGPGFRPPKEEEQRLSPESFENMNNAEFENEVKKIINEIKQSCDAGDFNAIMSLKNKLWPLNEAWNKKANDVWEQFEPGKGMTEQGKLEEKKAIQKLEQQDPYYWIKRDQENRRKVNQLQEQNYQTRKSFYLELFSGYNKEEYYFEQTNFEKRLIEEFKERGEEICNNNQDDNDNEQVDCDDAQCGGKVCGKGTSVSGNETGQVDFYCIAGACQAKEEINETEGPVCGNHICEQGEKTCSSSVNCNEDDLECFATADCGMLYCPSDCVECPVHDIISCNGEVIFSGEDEKGCPLPPICIEEDEFCDTDINCPQPTCGVAECTKEKEGGQGICKVVELTLCGGECEDGEKQIKECDNGEQLVVGICMGGMWIDTDEECLGVEKKVCCGYSGPADEPLYEWREANNCQSPEGAEFGDKIVDNSYCLEGEPRGDCNQHCWDDMSNKMPECPGDMKISGTYPDCSCDWVCDEIVDNECVVASDCGGENDVCSNGKCETIPYKEPKECPQIPISKWCSDEETLCPMTEDGDGCSVWDCGSCESEEEPEPEAEEEPESEEEPEPEPQEESEEVPITGEVIFGFFRSLLSRMRITGYAVEEGGENEEPAPEPEPEPEKEPDSEPEPEPDEPGPGPEPDNDCADKWKACGGSCPPCDYDEGPGEGEDWEEDKEGEGKDDSEEWEERDREERGMREREQRGRCEQECARPCIDRCIREACGNEMDCNIDEESRKCEGECSPDDNCIEKCMSGEEDWWKEFQEENQEEKGVFQVGGGCRKEKGRTGGYIWFGGWGDPFGQIEPLKHKYYEFGHEDWCKHEVDNLIRQRQEFEKGFNQEFAVWFFEKYLPNSAEEWEQAQSGIFELYWSNVDNQMRLAHNMRCLEKNDISEIMNINLINIEYETEYGKLEYWEELRTVNMPELDGSVTIISPYMRAWVFPSKEFIKYDMQESMKNHEFPGPAEENTEKKNQGGLDEEFKNELRENEDTMEGIRALSAKYGGNLDVVFQFKDYETNEVVFNVYGKINEEDIMDAEPMPYEEVPEEDFRIEIDFEKVYEMILVMEKDMMGDHVESPPWDRRLKPIQKIRDIGNGIKMWFRMRAVTSSAKIYPEGERGIDKIGELFFKMMLDQNKRGPEGPGDEKGEGEGEEKGKSPEGFDEGISGKAVFVF